MIVEAPKILILPLDYPKQRPIILEQDPQWVLVRSSKNERTMETTNHIYFSHLPLSGFSVGFCHEGNELYGAVSLTNDGFRSDGTYKKSRKDTFSRPRARGIINGRIKGAKFANVFLAENGEEIAFKLTVPTDFNIRRFMFDFRKEFKPLPKEIAEDGKSVKTLWDRLDAWRSKHHYGVVFVKALADGLVKGKKLPATL